MDYLCKFLSLDLYDLLLTSLDGGGNCKQKIDSKASGCAKKGKQPEECNSLKKSNFVVDQLSYTIHHKYPKRLVTYDAEEACEPRLIRFGDLSNDVIESMLEQCRKEMADEKLKQKSDSAKKDKDDRDEALGADCNKGQQQQSTKPQCQQPRSIFQMLKNLAAASCSSQSNASKKPSNSCSQTVNGLLSDNSNSEPTDLQLSQLERLAKQLHDNSLRACPKKQEHKPATKWNAMQPTQKLRFYWEALTGDVLCETPYENFKQSYAKIYLSCRPRIGKRRLQEQMRQHWHCMDSGLRMPFILQSLIYHVSMGTVDLSDHFSVRAALRKLR